MARVGPQGPQEKKLSLFYDVDRCHKVIRLAHSDFTVMTRLVTRITTSV